MLNFSSIERDLLLVFFCDGSGDDAVQHCRGLLARSIMQAQAASPTFTHVYAALVAVINTKVSFALILLLHCTA